MSDERDNVYIDRELVRRASRRQIELARRSMVQKRKHLTVVEAGERQTLTIVREGVGPIENDYGEFALYAFRVDDRWDKYSALVRAAAIDDEFAPIFSTDAGVFLRIDSGCETGQLFHDRTCECQQQLLLAMRQLTERGEGLIIHVPRQDGRGMGLPFKLATLRLQSELDLDTVQASALLEPNESRDTRTYSGAIAVLMFLGVVPPQRVLLATNNPKKASVFTENGYELDYSPIVVEPTVHTRRHLEAKQQHLGHRGLLPQLDDCIEDLT